jgi:gas vesicle protein
MDKKLNLTESLSQIGSKTLEKSKRLQNQANDFLQEYYKKLREDENLQEQKNRDALTNGVGFSQSSAYMRNKNRTQLAEQAIKYNNRASTIVMTDILSNIVEEALLMETDEYAELNPAYKANIRETVLTFLENADLNESVKDKRTLTLMEYIARNLPDVKTGIYLKEEEIVDIVKKSTPKEVNNSIDSLVGDVKERVANLVSDEQEAEEELQDQIDEIVAISEAAKAKKKAKASKQDDKVAANAEAVADEEGVDPSVTAPESEEPLPPAEEMAGQEIPADMAGMGDVDMAGEENIPGDGEINMDMAGPKGKETNISIGPDGTVNLNIRESFIKEYPKKGILETFAFNEAMEMLEEGKEYNGDLALANAIMYITILETFNATGLMNISPVQYKKLAER